MVQKLQNFIDDREDLRWVKRAMTGDREGFDKLILKHQKRIYYTVRKLVWDQEATHDIVQDVFVKAYLKLHQFDPCRPFYPWLHRIAVNTALNALKARQRQGEMDFPDESLMDAGQEDPETVMVFHEFERAAADALGRLPESQRTVFILRTSEGMSYDDIARALEISTGTVMSRLSRARERLKQMLAAYLPEIKTKV